MEISSKSGRSVKWRVSPAVAFAALAALGAAGLAGAGAAGGAPPGEEQPWFTLPFLDLFFHQDAVPEALAATMRIEVAGGSVPAYLARPKVPEPLPAVLLLPTQQGLTDWVKRSAREIAGIGYVVLAVDYDPEHMAARSLLLRDVAGEQFLERLGAAFDWLSGRGFVDPARIGVMGWSQSAEWVLRLAEKQNFQAAVVFGGGVCAQPAPLFELHSAPVLLISGDRDGGCTMSQAAALQKRLETAGLPHTVSVHPGAGDQFMDAARTTAAEKEESERAWIETYDFLAKHVEDANLGPTSPSQQTPGKEDQIARIVDIMRVINAGEGVRGALARSLSAIESGKDQWELARSQAAILAEAGNLLLARRPSKGPPAGWKWQARQFRGAARTLLDAVESHDLGAARQAMAHLSVRCASCHSVYRVSR